jgi:hypothetical protein
MDQEVVALPRQNAVLNNISSMSLTSLPLRIPFSHTDVEEIVIQELEHGTNELKDRVTLRVRDIVRIGEKDLPERVISWIYNLCLPHTAGLPVKVFTGKLAKPIDLASLPNREH